MLLISSDREHLRRSILCNVILLLSVLFRIIAASHGLPDYWFLLIVYSIRLMGKLQGKLWKRYRVLSGLGNGMFVQVDTKPAAFLPEPLS